MNWYVTQPSISKSIAKLEEELQVPLFHHRKGRIELNEYGSVFLSSVSIAFAQLESGAQTIQRMYETNQHVLSLGSNISAYLPAVLPGFFAQHPEIGIRQRDMTTAQMIDAILDRSLTLGISSEPIEHELIRFQELGHKEYMLVVHQDNPVAASDHVSVEALKRETFIVDASVPAAQAAAKNFARSMAFCLRSALKWRVRSCSIRWWKTTRVLPCTWIGCVLCYAPVIICIWTIWMEICPILLSALPATSHLFIPRRQNYLRSISSGGFNRRMI